MKKVLIVCLAVLVAPAALAELVSNHDFSAIPDGDLDWNHAGYAGWGGSFVNSDDGDVNDGIDNHLRTVGWGDGSWTNSYIWQDTTAVFQANTVYTLEVEYRDPTGQGTDVQLVLYETGAYADVASVFTGIPPANVWMTDTLVLDTAANPGIVGLGIGVGVRAHAAAGGWMDVNSVSLTIPEPTTMALLGLGGLLLRKRR